MLIFGWGFQTTKNFGPVFKNFCGHCYNEEYWTLTRIMTWFTLFFIPIFPYKIKHYLACPICKYGMTLKGEQAARMHPIAEINQLLVEEKITIDEYHAKINLLNGSAAEVVHAEVIETGVIARGGSIHLNYCANCGTQVTKDSKFCGNCGVAVSTK